MSIVDRGRSHVIWQSNFWFIWIESDPFFTKLILHIASTDWEFYNLYLHWDWIVLLLRHNSIIFFMIELCRSAGIKHFYFVVTHVKWKFPELKYINFLQVNYYNRIYFFLICYLAKTRRNIWFKQFIVINPRYQNGAFNVVLTVYRPWYFIGIVYFIHNSTVSIFFSFI